MMEPTFEQQQKIKDNEHIKLLIIFHYISGALGIFALLFLLLHFLMMNTFMGNEELWEEAMAQSQTTEESAEVASGEKPADTENVDPLPLNPFEFFKLFRWFYVIMALFILTFMVMEFLSAYFMTKRKNRTFSIVTGGLNCLQMPIGTALGVLTIIVLLRPSVIQAYEEKSAAVLPDDLPAD